jgi:hypothetical protein|tara:strand:+ start:750 stop:1370 length:621 start_codon:yes stop_codon:yes gene_type:complete
MAIADGLTTTCSNLQSTGGIQTVFIREWNSTGSPDQIATLGTGTITSIADSGGSTSTWGVYETKLETPVLAISGSSVGNANTYECTLTFNLPQADLARRNSLTDLQGKCLQVMMLDTNGTYFVMGISGTLTGGDGGLDLAAASHIGTRPQTFARLSAIEGGTGAAFSDESVLTVTLTCVQYELPRTYVAAGAAVSINAAGLVATVS